MRLEADYTMTLADALADALRRIMAIDGKPARSDYHPKQQADLYEEHMRDWRNAVAALERYEHESQ